uniref:Queuine tRNA-ribosyltransferase accessory subunit 2 n=1 Tax=Lygus hesperus TaxID=30085 RepID=A0A0A9WJF6_LYGHE
MKFSVKTIGPSKLRSGTLTGFKRLPEMVLETPLLLLYTKGGSVPHITHEVLQLITTDNQAVQQTLPSTVLNHDAVREFKKGLPKFVGLQECMTYLSIQDPAHKTPEGFNRKKEVSVWTHAGRVSLDADRYMDVVEAFQPDMFEALSNGDTNADTTKKKIGKVVDSTRDLYEDCLQRHSRSSILKDSSFLAVLEGGYDLEARKKVGLSYSDAPVDGFVINGLHNNGADVEKIDFQQIRALIEATIEPLPENKLRVLHGGWTPRNVLKLVEMGIDVFDASYPYLATERMCALTFNFEAVEWDTEVKDDAESLDEISLKDANYREDFTPFLVGCRCLACTKHTKAYVHHLINNKELLSYTLLMIHNTHHYLEFFKAIRQATSQGKKLTLKY